MGRGVVAVDPRGPEIHRVREVVRDPGIGHPGQLDPGVVGAQVVVGHAQNGVVVNHHPVGLADRDAMPVRRVDQVVLDRDVLVGDAGLVAHEDALHGGAAALQEGVVMDVDAL